ncbi:hypothetical protein O9929_15005 [Vibrio lentus]|nr:hypothetical protein [Vibrio lentus]
MIWICCLNVESNTALMSFYNFLKMEPLVFERSGIGQHSPEHTLHHLVIYL